MNSESLINELKDLASRNSSIQTIILFGSEARGQAQQGSDVDLCLVLNSNSKKADIQQKILALEKKYDKNINVIFTNPFFDDLDHTLIETFLREGIPIHGSFPKVPIQQLKLEPYEILKFDLSNIDHSEKMKIKRLLYGLTTKKRYHDKVYESHTKGLVEELGGIRIGIASLLIPEKESWRVEEAMKPYKISLRKITIWLSKP